MSGRKQAREEERGPRDRQRADQGGLHKLWEEFYSK